MRFKLIITLLLPILFYVQNSFSQDFQWVRQVKGLNDHAEYSGFIEVDQDGNTYTLGKSHSFQFDIDPTPNGVQIIDNQAGTVAYPENIYLIKLNSDGDFIWGKTFSILKDEESILGLKFDSQGNIYVLAYITELYQNQAHINGYGPINIIKIDPNGNEIYRRKIQNIGNINDGLVFATATFDLDSSDNIYVSGTFKNTVILDNNPQNNLIANGVSSYLLKLNQNGNILWTKNLNNNTTGALRLLIDSNDDINLSYYSPIGTYTFSANLSKMDNSNGNTIWTKSFENAILNNFILMPDNSFAFIGLASNQRLVDLNPDPNISNIIQDKSFLLSLDPDGNYQDSRLFELNVSFGDLTIDQSNNYHLAGSFSGTNIDFDPSANNHYMSSLSSYADAFYLKLNQNKDFVNSIFLGYPFPYSDGGCASTGITSLKALNENIYLTGIFQGTDCDFDSSSTSSYLLNSINTNVLNFDGFMLKIGNCETTAPTGQASQSFCSAEHPKISNLSPNNSSIKWYDSPTSTTPLNVSDFIVDGQTYYAAKQIGNCPESNRLAITAHINPSPQQPTANDQSFCENRNPTIGNLVCSGQNIQWYDSLTGGNLLSTTTVLQNGTTYYATQTINNCESERKPVLVTLIPSPTPVLNPAQQFCMQQNATLNEITITGQNIQWYDALTAGNLLPLNTLLQNGVTYYASQTITNCESARVPVVISIQNTPAPTGNTNQSFCSTQGATLNDIAIAGTGVLWYSSSVSTQPLSITTLLADNTIYYATQTINGCESVVRFQTTITLINTLNATDYSDNLCDDLNNGSETVNLTSYNTQLIANSTNYIFKYYTTSNGAASQTASDEISNFTNYNLSVGSRTIYVRITSSNSCYQIVALQLTLFSKPIPNISDSITLCEGSSIVINAGAGFDAYLWSTGATTSSMTITTPGNYSVSVSQNHGNLICTTVKNFQVVNSNAATISQIITSDWTTDENAITVMLASNSSGNYEYSLDGINYQSSNIFTGLKNGEYTVYIRDKNNCGITDESIYLLMHPKYFTPNGDGYNDYWRIKLSEYEPNLIIKIFDRYGKLLKVLTSNNIGWDGTFNGQSLPSTDYWFTVTRENGKEYKGHFALKR